MLALTIPSVAFFEVLMPATAAPLREPGWSLPQQKLFLRAARAADWNDVQRYIAMRHVGCPLLGKEGDKDRRPSVKHPRNTNTHFDLLMGLAEAHALTRGRGDKMPRRLAAKKDLMRFWRDAAKDKGQRMRRLVGVIAAEAEDRLGTVFAPGFLAGFITRMTMKDDPAFCGLSNQPRELLACDEGQVYRILEGLKVWVTRKFAEAGIKPQSFSAYRARTPKPTTPKDQAPAPDPAPENQPHAASDGGAA